MIADYYFIRKKILLAPDLYASQGAYTYRNGYNFAALIALLAGILPNAPGFLVTVHLIPADAVPFWISNLYHYAWFVGFAVSFIVYWVLMKRKA